MGLAEELPVYKKSYDLLLQLFELTRHFKREYKYTIGKPLEKVASKVYKNKKAALEKGELISISFDLNYIEKIKLALNYWVEENKFLEVESSIYSISKDINLPFHHITYFFNQVNDEKYIDWRNRLRVEYAINLIKNKKGFHQTIESLGKESGFKSNSAFIRCFK